MIAAEPSLLTKDNNCASSPWRRSRIHLFLCIAKHRIWLQARIWRPTMRTTFSTVYRTPKVKSLYLFWKTNPCPSFLWCWIETHTTIALLVWDLSPPPRFSSNLPDYVHHHCAPIKDGDEKWKIIHILYQYLFYRINHLTLRCWMWLHWLKSQESKKKYETLMEMINYP